MASQYICPIGVPKTPYRLAGEEETTWVDIYNILYRERNVFVMQEIQDEIAGQVSGILKHLEGQKYDPKAPVNVFINSTGGSIFAGFAIHDCLACSHHAIHTYCLGLAASMATIVLLAGDSSQRLVAENSRLMIHQPSTGYYDGQAGECTLESGEILKMRCQVTKIYRQKTGKFPWEISDNLERDYFFSAEQAINYGLADGICEDLPVLFITHIEEIQEDKQELLPVPPPKRELLLA